MERFDEGLRCQDIHAGLRNVDPNSGALTPLADTQLIGMAASLAALVRGQDVIADAQALRAVALHGGAIGLREKQQLAKLLAGLREGGALPAEVDIDPLPKYYPTLRELVVRVMRRPDRVLPALRLLELLTAIMALGERVEPADLGSLHEDLAAKQAADLVGFLVTTAGLDNGFRTRARSLLLGEPVDVGAAQLPLPTAPS